MDGDRAAADSRPDAHGHVPGHPSGRRLQGDRPDQAARLRDRSDQHRGRGGEGQRRAENPVRDRRRAVSWNPATRVTFRFAVAYLALYCLATQVIGGLLLFPGFSFPGFGTIWPMRQITTWVASLLRVTSPLTTTGNSGDTAFYWVQTFWLLVVALIVTLAWSDLDRKRLEYTTL